MGMRRPPAIAGSSPDTINIANYVLRKLDLVSFTLMDEVASFCRVVPGTRPLPDPDRPRGLVHFNGVVGDSAVKHAAIENYFAYLASV